MRPDLVTRAVSSIRDAALDAAVWPQALEAIAQALGGIGAACILRNRQSDRVEWTSFVGPIAELTADYVDHYAALDPYSPLVAAAPRGHWLQLTQCLPGTLLCRDAWYNDHVRRATVADILGTQLADSPSYNVFVGVHYGQHPPARDKLLGAGLTELTAALGLAARVHVKRGLAWRAEIVLKALDQLAAGIIVTTRAGRVIEMNAAAERIVRRGDGLILRHGKIDARRVCDSHKLAAFIVAAAGQQPEPGRMFVGRPADRPGYALIVTALGAGAVTSIGPMTLVLVTDPDGRAPSELDAAEFYGLSRAESRLAAALMTGMTLRGFAASSGLQITTLRTQLRSILRKVGVARQIDLVRVLAAMPVLPVDSAEAR